jgi:hypothetical protein
VVAAANSAIICVIGVRTAQTGFIPANLFCLALYGYNIFQWCSVGPEGNASNCPGNGTKTDAVQLTPSSAEIASALVSPTRIAKAFHARKLRLRTTRSQHRMRPRSARMVNTRLRA